MNNKKTRSYYHWNKDIEDQENLQCCDTPSINTIDGNLVCINCGIVIGAALVDVEQRAFTQEEINKRKRTEKKWRDIGPRTFIGKERADFHGNKLDAKGKTLYNRLDRFKYH